MSTHRNHDCRNTEVSEVKVASDRKILASTTGTLRFDAYLGNTGGVGWYSRLRIISAQNECILDPTHRESGLPLFHATSDGFM